MSYLPGSCIVCGQGTDTAVGVDGEAEWHIAAIQMLGVPKDEAPAVHEAAVDSEPRAVPVGRYRSTIRVCAACVSKSVFHPRLAPALYVEGGMLPTIGQPLT